MAVVYLSDVLDLWAGVHHTGFGGHVDHSTQLFSLGAKQHLGGQSVAGPNRAIF